MPEQEDIRSRGVQRYRITSPRNFAMGILTFAQPVRTEHIVRIVDFSVVGVGIELAGRIEPGLVYFKEPIGGQKFGVLVWSKQRGEQYRAGIKFVVLSPDEEVCLLEQGKQPHPYAAPRASDKIIASLIDSLQREAHG